MVGSDCLCIGLLKEPGNTGNEKFGNAFFVSEDTIVTAKHTVDNFGEICTVELTLNEKTVLVNTDAFEFPYDNLDIAFYRFANTPFGPIKNKCFNTTDNFQETNVCWSISGFLKVRGGYSLYSVYGSKCRRQNNLSVLLLDSESVHADLAGISGSPAYINGMIVGIVIKTGNYGQAEIIPVGCFREKIAKSFQVKYIYSNKHIPPKNYCDLFDNFQLTDYISRICTSFQSDEIIPQHFDLFEYIKQQNYSGKIVLLGDGDIGKTFEMKRLAILLSQTEKEHPIYVDLRKYNSSITKIEDFDEEIATYIKQAVPFCLLLDGCDDIISDERRKDFCNKLNSFHPNTNSEYMVIVSIRKNYYRSNMFEDYEEFELCPLNDCDIQNILDTKQLNTDAFLDEVKKKDLQEECRYPYYLMKLISIFHKKSSLPPQKELFEIIIDSVLEDCYLEHDNLGEGLSQFDNVTTKNYLSQIAALFCAMGGNQLTDGTYNCIFSEGKVTQKEVIKKSGFLGMENGLVYFIHSNTYEYLMARYLNTKYKDDNLDSMLDLIQNHKKTNILPKYRNIIKYIVSTRETTDFLAWLLDSYPSAADYFENQSIDPERLQNKFKDIFDYYTENSLFIQYHADSKFDRWVEITDTTGFLLSILTADSSDTALINALYLLSVNPRLSEKSELVTAALTKMMTRDFKTDSANLIMDNLLKVLIYGKIDGGICDLLMDKMCGTDNRQLTISVCEYLHAINRADDYYKFIINAISQCAQHSHLSSSVIQCISAFQTKTSIVCFYNFWVSVIKQSKPTNVLPSLMTEGLFTATVNAFSVNKMTKPEIYLIETVLFRLAVMHQKNILDKWSGLSNVLGCEKEILEDLFVTYNRYPIQFTLITHKYSEFVSFLTEKYTSGMFKSNPNFMIMSIKYLEKTSPEHTELRAFLTSRTGDSLAEEILKETELSAEEEFTTQKNEEIRQIFEPDYFHEVMIAIINSSQKDDLSYSEFNESATYFSDKQVGFAAMNLLNTCSYGYKSVMHALNEINKSSENQNKFFIENISRFVRENNNYEVLLSDEQKSRINDFCLDYLTKTNFTDIIKYKEDDYQIDTDFGVLTSILHLTYSLKIEVPKEKLIEMLYIPTVLFSDSSCQSIPNLLREKLSDDEITEQLKKWNDQSLIHGYYIDICLSYCKNFAGSIDFLNDAAIQKLTKQDYQNQTMSAWCYLESHRKLSEIIEYIANGSVDLKTIANHIESLVPYSEICEYCSVQFDRLYQLRLDIIDDRNNIEKAKTDFPFLFEYNTYDDQQAVIRSIEHFLQRLFVYLSTNDIGAYNTHYLDEILTKKEKSIFDYDEVQTKLSGITQLKYLDKMINIFKLLNSNEFHFHGSFSTMRQDIESALTAMSKQDYTAVYDKIAVLTKLQNEHVKRAAFVFLRVLENTVPQVTSPDIHKTIRDIFLDNPVYPF